MGWAQATLAGTVRNTTAKEVTVLFPNQLLGKNGAGYKAEYKAALTEGSFTFENLPLTEAGEVLLLVDGRSVPLYLEPHDALTVVFDYMKTADVLFAGTGANNNELYTHFRAMFPSELLHTPQSGTATTNLTTLKKGIFTYPISKERDQQMRTLDIKPYAAILKTNRTNQHEHLSILLDEYGKYVSPTFREYLNAEIDYEWAYYMLVNGSIYKTPEQLSPEYYDFLYQIATQNERMAGNAQYQRFIVAYIDFIFRIDPYEGNEYIGQYDIAAEHLKDTPLQFFRTVLVQEAYKAGSSVAITRLQDDIARNITHPTYVRELAGVAAEYGKYIDLSQSATSTLTTALPKIAAPTLVAKPVAAPTVVSPDAGGVIAGINIGGVNAVATPLPTTTNNPSSHIAAKPTANNNQHTTVAKTSATTANPYEDEEDDTNTGVYRPTAPALSVAPHNEPTKKSSKKEATPAVTAIAANNTTNNSKTAKKAVVSKPLARVEVANNTKLNATPNTDKLTKEAKEKTFTAKANTAIVTDTKTAAKLDTKMGANRDVVVGNGAKEAIEVKDDEIEREIARNIASKAKAKAEADRLAIIAKANAERAANEEAANERLAAAERIKKEAEATAAAEARAKIAAAEAKAAAEIKAAKEAKEAADRVAAAEAAKAAAIKEEKAAKEAKETADRIAAANAAASAKAAKAADDAKAATAAAEATKAAKEAKEAADRVVAAETAKAAAAKEAKDAKEAKAAADRIAAADAAATAKAEKEAKAATDRIAAANAAAAVKAEKETKAAADAPKEITTVSANIASDNSVSGSAVVEPVRRAVVMGCIENAVAKEIVLQIPYQQLNDSKVEYSTTVRDGLFRIDNVDMREARIVVLAYARNRAEIYLEPGDSLFVNCDANAFQFSMKYSGRGASNNNCLAEFNNKFYEERNFFNMMQSRRGVHVYTVPNDLEVKMLSQPRTEYEAALLVDRNGKRDAIHLYEQDKAPLTKRFKDFMTAEIDYDWAYKMLTYGYLYAGRHSLSPDFFNFLQEVPIQNSPVIGSEKYQRFLLGYVNYIHSLSPKGSNAYVEQYDFAATLLKGKCLQFFRSAILVQAFRESNMEKVLDQYSDFMNNNPNPDLSSPLANLYQELNRYNSGSPAPNFSLTDRDGKMVSLSDFKGKVVYLDFWATWCGACMNKLTKMRAIEAQMMQQDNNIVFLHISLDRDQTTWKNTVAENGFGGIHLYAGQASLIQKQYEAISLPEYYIVYRDGNFAKKPKSYDVEDLRQALIHLASQSY